MLKLFRIVGVLEAVSYLLLIGVGMPLKYVYGMPAANMALGSGHGFLFVLFCVLLALVITQHALSWKVGVVGFFAACLPLGPFFFHPYLQKKLDGQAGKPPVA